MNEGMSMNRTMRGLAVLAIGVGAWACKGDPQGDLRGDAVKVDASPSSIFVNQGESELVVLEVLDDQGNELGISDFAMVSNDPLINVVEDSAFNLVYDAAGVATRPDPWTRARFVVSGVGGTDGTLSASGSGLSMDIPVKVIPAAIPAVFTPAAGDPGTAVTVTAAGYSFLASAALDFGLDPNAISLVAPILSAAADGSSITVCPLPGSSGGGNFSDVAISFLPTTPLALPGTGQLDITTNIVALPGTDDPLTAPTLATPAAVGETTCAFDAGSGFDAAGDKYYNFDVPVDGTYTITLYWSNGADEDLFVGSGFSFYDQPEAVTTNLTAGSNEIIVELFAGTTPAWIGIYITRDADS